MGMPGVDAHQHSEPVLPWLLCRCVAAAAPRGEQHLHVSGGIDQGSLLQCTVCSVLACSPARGLAKHSGAAASNAAVHPNTCRVWNEKTSARAFNQVCAALFGLQFANKGFVFAAS